MPLKDILIKLTPRRYRLPLRYLSRRMRGALDSELYLLRGLIGGADKAIDVGANVGLYSYALSRLCRSVESFEPNPVCAMEIEAYRACNIQVHRVGLSSVSGSRALKIPIVNGVADLGGASISKSYDHQTKIDVPVRTLDQYGFAGVSFIKIDVEGHELEVLKGANETISRERPTVLIEVEQRHLPFPMEVVFEEILKHGYRGYFIVGGVTHPLPEFSFEIHQKPFANQAMITSDAIRKGYVANFVFRPEQERSEPVP